MEISNQMVIESILFKQAQRGSFPSEDFGPQAFCKHCGMRLVDKIIHQDKTNYWFHPVTESEDFCHIGDPEVMVEVYETEDIIKGFPSRDHLDMDGLKDVFRKLKGKDALWLKQNSKLLKKVYYEHSDDAGTDKHKECNPFLEEVNDDEGNVTVEGTSVSDAPTVTWHTEESYKRLAFWRKVTHWLVRSPDKVLYDMVMEKFWDEENEDIMYEEEFEYLMHVTNSFGKSAGKWRYVLSMFMKNKSHKWDYNPNKSYELDTYKTKKGGDNMIIHNYTHWYGKKPKMENLDEHLKILRHEFDSRKWKGEKMLGMKILNKQNEVILEWFKRNKDNYQWVVSRCHPKINEQIRNQILTWALSKEVNA